MSAFRCYALDTSEKFAIEKNNFAFASFDPFWNTSTENQWEISEVGRLTCFVGFLHDFTFLFVMEHLQTDWDRCWRHLCV